MKRCPGANTSYKAEVRTTGQKYKKNTSVFIQYRRSMTEIRVSFKMWGVRLLYRNR